MVGIIRVEKNRSTSVPTTSPPLKADSRARPFLRWAGGKQQLTGILASHAPENLTQLRYVEPFLGAASLFFSTLPKKALVNDANPHLINTYLQLRDNPAGVEASLARLILNHSPVFYYATRDAYNAGDASGSLQAARFIYLNKACFNGIFRVNMKGEFNVPKGSKDSLTSLGEKEVKSISAALKSVEITSEDFALCMEKVKADDFVYLDPPYPALNATAYFAHYTTDRFKDHDQERLAESFKAAHKIGARLLMSNADVDSIRVLYKDFALLPVPVRRFVSCKGKRIQVSELIIKNY